jgi:hypothetical protein
MEETLRAKRQLLWILIIGCILIITAFLILPYLHKLDEQRQHTKDIFQEDNTSNENI